MSIPLDDGYEAFRSVCPRIFRVEAAHGAGRATATAFAFARLLESNRLVLATAGHVLNDVPPDNPVEWRFQQFDEDGGLERQVTVTTREDDVHRPYAFYKLADIGYFILPANDDTGAPLARPNEQPLPVIDVGRRIKEGGRVAWAGFPSQVEHFCKRPQLCYFEGVVSAFCPRPDAPGHAAYVVDGHAAHGVSGGPMWHWPEDDGRIEIVGIVSSFRGSPAQADSPVIPGFCVFEPINPLIARIEAMFNSKVVET